VTPARRAAILVAAAAQWSLAAAASAPPACVLLLARVPLDAREPAFRVAFTHSVLGTPVEDRYVFRPGAAGWQAVLVEERWQGEGYGLPIAAAPGEALERDGAGWRLRLARVVDPLVVLTLPSQRMRVLVDGQPPLLLGSLGPPPPASVAMHAEGCADLPTPEKRPA
jgi:hypothetical protein